MNLYGIAFDQSIPWSLSRPRDIVPGDVWIKFPSITELGMLTIRPVNLGRDVWVELSLGTDVSQISQNANGDAVIYFESPYAIALDGNDTVPNRYNLFISPFVVEAIGTLLNQTAVLTVPLTNIVGSAALNYINPRVVNNPKVPPGFGNTIAPTPSIVETHYYYRNS